MAFRSTLRGSRKSGAIRLFSAAPLRSFTSSYPLASLSPIFRIFFQVPYPASPLFATLTKTPGVSGYSSHFGTARAGCLRELSTVFKFFLFRSLRSLLHFFAPTKSPTLFFSSASALRVKKHPRWGYSQHCNVQAFNLQTFKRSSRPIAAKRLWCHNRQRHEISLRYGETTPLPPVSKNTRADIGN